MNRSFTLAGTRVAIPLDNFYALRQREQGWASLYGRAERRVQGSRQEVIKGLQGVGKQVGTAADHLPPS